jgi:hypothetical protein
LLSLSAFLTTPSFFSFAFSNFLCERSPCHLPSPLSPLALLGILDSLIPGARKHHKGPRAVTLAKNSKQPAQQKRSMQRRELLFAGPPSTGLGSTVHLRQLPTERSRDNRTHEEKMAVLEWVSYLFLPPFFFFLSFLAFSS